MVLGIAVCGVISVHCVDAGNNQVWVRFVHLNSLIESCVFLYLWNSPFDTFL